MNHQSRKENIMKLQELFDHKQDLETRKQDLSNEERQLNIDTTKYCIEHCPEALKIDWNRIKRIIRHS